MTPAIPPARAKRVLHIGKYFPPHVGGMESYLRDLMCALAKLGVQTSALVHQSQSGVSASEERFSADRVEFSVSRAATWGRLLFTPLSPGFPWLLDRLIKRDQPDVLHLHLPNPSAFWALILPSARRLPWVIHWQSDVLTNRSHWLLKLAYLIYAPFESALLKRAHSIVATSPPYLATSKALIKFATKCSVIPLGIEDRFGGRARDNESLDADAAPAPGTSPVTPLKVLAIGRMTHYKGFDVLLRAIAQTEGVTLDLVGDGDQAASLRQLADCLDLSHRVRFHGLLDDDARDTLLARCDCLCLPSNDRTESFGIVLLEAMSASKPCVVSDIAGSGMSWLVEDGKTGLVAPTNHVEGLAAALCQLRDDPGFAARMGKNGREKFLKALTIEASALAIRDLYENLPSGG